MNTTVISWFIGGLLLSSALTIATGVMSVSAQPTHSETVFAAVLAAVGTLSIVGNIESS